MKNRNRNKLRMYRAVRQVVQKYNSSWTGLVAFENAVTEFTQKVAELEKLSFQKAKALVGAKSTRDQQREVTADLTLQVANAIYAYAAMQEDEALKAKVHYSPSALKYGPNNEFLQSVEGVLNKAKELINDLDHFGVNQSMIDDLELAYLEMVDIVNLPRQAVVSRKVITEKIDGVISDLDEVLKDQLDRLIVLLKDDEQEFVLTYEGARTIINHPATRRRLNLDEDQEDAEEDTLGDQGINSP